MKRLFVNWRLCAMLVCVFAAGCSKTADVVPQPSFTDDGSGVAVDATNPALCKLRQLKQQYGPGAIYGNFTYNKLGDPVSVLYQNGEGGTGNPSYYFKYDKQNRLIEMHKAYQNDALIVETHRYAYSQYNSIARDTATYSEGDIIREVSFLKYDNIGRIVQEAIKPLQPAGVTRLVTYAYDMRGNLVIPDYYAENYDGKVCPLRTNTIFQFIHRNYSQNNPAAATRYNSKGLPLDMMTYRNGLFYGGETTAITYDCP